MLLMITVAVISTVAATVVLIATMVAYHVEANDVRRERSLARLRADHLRRRNI